MADDITIPATGSGTATPVVATDDVGGKHYQRVKIDGGGDGLAAPIGGDATNGLDVDVTRSALPTGASTLAEQQTQTASLSVMDDWDESDRAKVNLIVGQAGVQGASGAVSALTQRVVLATDVGLPAGTNNIGDVDVLTLPALPAGNNNIGDVDVVSSTLPTGASTLAEQQTQTTALQLIDDTVFVDDAAFTVATSKVTAIGLMADQASTDSVNEGDIGIPRMTLDRKQITTVAPSADTEGLAIFRTLDADETEEDVKTSAGKLYGWFIYNDGAAEVYVKFYNLTAANTTVGSSTPILTIPIPAGSASNVEFTNGITFDTALCIAATTGVADADSAAPAANQCVANVFYK